MQPINALSLSPAVNRWLANSHHPHILHIFDHACNLINERREVLSIVTSQIGNGPFNLVIPSKLQKSFQRVPDLSASQQTPEISFNHLSPQSPVSISADQITLGNITIHTADTKLWSPRPDWESLHAKRNDILAQLTNYQIRGFDTCTAPDAVRCKCTLLEEHSELLNHQHVPITNYQSPIFKFSNTLLSAITTQDIQSSQYSARKLAGLGVGLTPAGDDFILGAVLAAWIIHPLDIARKLAQEITNTAAPLTTSLSAAWLKSAGKGEAGILWHNFFEALVSAGQIDNLTCTMAVQEAMDKILAIGETSGADALAGFIGVFMSWMQLKEKELTVHENSSG